MVKTGKLRHDAPLVLASQVNQGGESNVRAAGECEGYALFRVRRKLERNTGSLDLSDKPGEQPRTKTESVATEPWPIFVEFLQEPFVRTFYL